MTCKILIEVIARELAASVADAPPEVIDGDLLVTALAGSHTLGAHGPASHRAARQVVWTDHLAAAAAFLGTLGVLCTDRLPTNPTGDATLRANRLVAVVALQDVILTGNNLFPSQFLAAVALVGMVRADCCVTDATKMDITLLANEDAALCTVESACRARQVTLGTNISLVKRFVALAGGW